MKTKSIGWWDIPAALFLVGALFSAAMRLNATNWTENLGRVQIIVLLGAVFGFALGKSIFSGRVTFVMGLVYSVFVIPWQLGLLVSASDWYGRLTIVYARIWYSVYDFIRNQPVRDPILFLTTMLILYWFASLLASYRLVRRANPWLPLLALGGMILVIEYTMEMYRYARIVGGAYSFIFLVFCLILMGRIYFLRSRKDWEQRGGTIELEVGYDLGRGVMVSAVILALLAWNTPRLVNVFSSEGGSQERISRGWQVFRDRISKAVNSLKSPSPMVVAGYGNNMFLGTGGALGDETVFMVKPQGGRPAGRMYWSGRNYDTYLNGQWVSTVADRRQMGPGQEPVVYPEWDLRREIQFVFSSQISLLQTLYYPAEPLTINRAASAIVAQTEDGTTDMNAITLDPPLKSGEEYSILSSVGRPTVAAMREAGTEYPDFIRDRYLQLPENFSPQVVELAREIAAGRDTPYDQSLAITQYLRRAITYTETVPEPPRNRDPIEWFLFDLRAGFCNYYAASEVLMLRSLGVPARIVIGYAEGTWNPELDQFTVISKDSHAWPEVYFPGLGWVVFEPTVSQPLTDFPLGGAAGVNGADDLSVTEPEGTEDPYLVPPVPFGPPDFLNMQNGLTGELAQAISPWKIVLGVFALLVAILALLEWRRRRVMSLPLPNWIEKSLDERGFRTPGWLRWWSLQAMRTPMENLFANVGLMLRIWGQSVEPSQTPYEQVSLLRRVVPGVDEQAKVLLEEYQRAMYSPYPANLPRARKAVDEIRTVGLRNWALRLAGFEA